MLDLSLHILDVAENGIRAGADRIRIDLAQDDDRDELVLLIEDNGRGMDEEQRRAALDPFYTTKPGRRIGLGLSLLEQAASQTGGSLSLESSPGTGTRVEARFHPSHPDMKPLGDLLGSLAALIGGNPGVRFVYTSRHGDDIVFFDSFEASSRESDD